MTKEQFIALGISEELANKAAEQSTAELKGYVTVTKFNEIDQEKKNLEVAAKTTEKALDDLKKNAGNSTDLQEQIQKLQDDARVAEQKHSDEMKEIRLNNAIKLSLSGKVHDEGIVASLFDKAKLILNDDDKVTGLDEQLKGIKESRPFLFKEEKADKPQGGFVKVGAEQQDNNQQSGKVSFKDAVAGHYQQAKQ